MSEQQRVAGANNPCASAAGRQEAKKFWQQGDLLLVQCDKMDEHACRVEARPLAVGEATGHAHRVRLEDVKADKVEFYQRFGALYVRVKEPITIVHEEHEPITLPPGLYQREIVREYDHFAEESRNVCD